MTHVLIPFASPWGGKGVACRFEASAEKLTGSKEPLAAQNEMAPVYTIPDGVHKVTVTATPTDQPYWPTTVELLVKDGGETLENADPRTAWVKLTPLGNTKSTVATIRVSRFKDVTTDVVKLLGAPPPFRSFKLSGKKAKDAGVKEGAWVAIKEKKDATINKLKEQYGKWPPDNWNVSSTPAYYLNVSAPVKSGVLNFALDTSVQVASDSVVLELKGVSAPKLFSVVWPLTAIYPVENAAPTPFLLFIRQGMGKGEKGNQYDAQGLFVFQQDLLRFLPQPVQPGDTLQPYPYNFDYANSLFDCLHYVTALKGHPIENAPFYWPFEKGVPNQVAKAGVNAVTVIPCNSFEHEFGVLEDTEQTRMILEELQAFMFSQAGVLDPPKHVGDTVIAAFSSGNAALDKWLNNSKNRAGDFLSDVVRAVYFLEPILDPAHKNSDRDVNDYIPVAQSWAGSGKGDKRIRLYMRYPSNAHKKLLSPKTPPSATPDFSHSTDNRFTAAVITFADWKAAFAKVAGFALPEKKVDWNYPHHLIAGTMLTHALAQIANGKHDLEFPP
jgi:hypothetical protein